MAAITVATAVPASAQPATKGAAKGADNGAKAADEPEAQPQQPNAKLLIGDAVENADSPQYQQVEEAINRFGNRRVKEARDLLIEVRTTHRQLPPAEILIAKLFIVYKQPQLALAELEQAVRKHPKDPEAYLMFADGSLNDGHVTAAEALYRDADELVKSFNENPMRKANFEKRVLQGLAAVAQSRQQWKTAETLLRQLIKLDPKNAMAYQRLGIVIFQQAAPDDLKTLSEAYSAFTAAIDAEPRMPHPDVAMGQLFEQAAQQALNTGDKAKSNRYRQQAIESFRRATEPKTKPGLNTLLAAAMWALQTNQFKPAQQYADAAMKNDAESLEAKLIAAIVARFSGNRTVAERLLKEAYNQSPAFPVSNQLALVLVESTNASDQKRALELAEINARANQNNAEAVSTYGWVLYQLGHKKEAGQVLENVIRSRALTPDSAYYVAQILADQGRGADAIQILEDAIAQPQPFANRTSAAKLLEETRKKLDSAAGDDEKKDSKSSKSGSPPARSSKGTK
ncbi:MAG: tetratricopeptide repeat protein [Pirellulales bacterium]